MRLPFSGTVLNYIHNRRSYMAVEGWKLSEERRAMFRHLLVEWTKYYLPNFSLQGKVVLDVGAGDGESALFFLVHGASRVVCVECDKLRIAYLKANAERHPLTVIPKRFALSQLSIPHDFMKMDIEGWEEELLVLKPQELQPTVAEVHGQQLADKFFRRGWHYLSKPGSGSCYCYMANYRKTRT